MDYETVKLMIETRLYAAEKSGNTAEQSLMTAMLAIAEENKRLKNNDSQGVE